MSVYSDGPRWLTMSIESAISIHPESVISYSARCLEIWEKWLRQPYYYSLRFSSNQQLVSHTGFLRTPYNVLIVTTIRNTKRCTSAANIRVTGEAPADEIKALYSTPRFRQSRIPVSDVQREDMKQNLGVNNADYRIYRFLTRVYITQNRRVSGLCSSSGIQINKKTQRFPNHHVLVWSMQQTTPLTILFSAWADTRYYAVFHCWDHVLSCNAIN
jgi:hypothetical protein